MKRRWLIGQLLMVCLSALQIIPGCQTSQVAATPAPAATGLAGIPAPSAYAQDTPRQTSTSLLQRYGAELDFLLRQNATIDVTKVHLQPAWSGGTSAFTTLAFGAYHFTLENYTGEATINLEWTTPPAAQNLWLGFSNWSRDRWDWYPCTDTAKLDLSPADFAGYTSASINKMLVCVVVLGTQEAVLDRIRVGAVTTPGGWVHTWGGVGDDVAKAVVTDDAGNIYVTGYTDSFRPESDVVTVKYAPDGTLLWKKSWGDKYEDRGLALTLDSLGSIYVAGYSTDNQYGQKLQDTMLLKYYPDGVLEWAQLWGGDQNEAATGVGIALSNVYVTGYTDGFGATGRDVLLCKYNPAGEIQWEKAWGDTGTDTATALATDGMTSLYLAGSTTSYGTSETDSDFLMLKYDLDGNQIYRRTWGGSAIDEATALYVNPASVYVTGSAQSFSAGGEDVAVLRYTTSGSLLIQTVWGTNSPDIPYSIKMGTDGALYIAGTITNWGMGSNDVMLLKLDSTVGFLWGLTWGGELYDHGFGLSIAGDGSIAIAGRAPRARNEDLTPYGLWLTTPPGVSTTPDGTTTTSGGASYDITTGIFNGGYGVELSPGGAFDEGGGGGQDVLVMRVELAP